MTSILRSRLRNIARATRYEAGSIVEDIALFTRMGNAHCAFRQSRIDGLNVLVRAEEDVGRSLYFMREFERHESSYLFRSVRETDICLDVGANAGFYTLGFAKRAVKGMVHAFEPLAMNYHMLALNVLSNEFANVTLNNCAVGEEDGEADLYIASDGAYCSLADTGRKAIVGTARTALTRLDSYCARRALSRVDLLKIDVEGAELAVLRGAEALLSDPARKPRLIMLELFEPMLTRFGSTVEEVCAFLKHREYEALVLTGGRLVPFTAPHYNHYYNVMFVQTLPSR